MARKVLLVEDDNSIATALEFVIAREGFAVERLDCGKRAVERIRAARPDLVVLDVMLPDASGYEICREVREDASLAGVRVLMMTARGSVTERRRAMDLGADGFITKPFEMAELRREVGRLVAR